MLRSHFAIAAAIMLLRSVEFGVKSLVMVGFRIALSMGVIESRKHRLVNKYLHHVYCGHGKAKEPWRSAARAA